MSHNRLHGLLTALVTPFSTDGVDMTAFTRFVEWQIAAGVNGLVPLGTTGESPTITDEEFSAIIKQVVEIAAGETPVVVGVGTNNTSLSIEKAKAAEALGADYIMVVAPYYNKPTPEGQIAHFKAIHDAVSLPVVVYNIPGRSVIDISIDTLAQMKAQMPRFVALKDATGDLARVKPQFDALGPDVQMLCGEDSLTADFCKAGGQGSISVVSNIVPKTCCMLAQLLKDGRYNDAEVLNEKLKPLNAALYIESSPAPAKYLLSKMQFMENRLRLPMVPVTSQTAAKLDSIFAYIIDEGLE